MTRLAVIALTTVCSAVAVHAGDLRATRRIGPVSKVLVPETRYECPDLPVEKSEVGEIDHPARQLRDPALFSDQGKLYLFYTFCGEQGIAGAEVTLAP